MLTHPPPSFNCRRSKDTDDELPKALIPMSVQLTYFDSLAPGKFEWNFIHVIFKQILVVDDWGISCEIALLWMSLDLTDD